MQKVQNKQKPFYPFLYGEMELKETKCHMNEQSKEQHFSIQLDYVVIQILPYKTRPWLLLDEPAGLQSHPIYLIILLCWQKCS